MDRPVSRPTCEYCGKSCFVHKPCNEWVRRHLKDLENSEYNLSLEQLHKLLDYVCDRGLMSIRKMSKIMDCNIEDISKGI